MTRRRLVELAFLLPWVGLFLLTPPIITMLHTWARVSGFPLLIVYIFACWLVLIAAGGIVATRLDWSTATRRREGTLSSETGD